MSLGDQLHLGDGISTLSQVSTFYMLDFSITSFWSDFEGVWDQILYKCLLSYFVKK